MRTRWRLTCTALAATAILAAAAIAADANHLHIIIPPPGQFKVVWRPLKFISGSQTVSCNVTLEGSISSSTITKSNGNLLARIYTASSSSCTGGTISFLTATVPWHARYRWFQGTLPHIKVVGLWLIGVSFKLQPTGLVECLARTTEIEPAILEWNLNESEEVTSAQMEPGASIALEGFLCEFAGEVHLEGTGAITSPEGVKPMVRLI